MSKRISHSAWNKYLTCPSLYDIHYNQRLRPTKTSSSLLFGSAMDEALNVMLLKSGDPYQVFKDNLTFEMMENSEFHDKDLDWEVFSAEQQIELKGSSIDFVTWAALRVKGRLLLEAYEKEILPKIKSVVSVQKEIEGRPGILDALVELQDGTIVLLDHKTSSYPYKREAALNSTQLALYSHHEKIDKIGFVVLLKNINKNKVKTCKDCGHVNSYSSHTTCDNLIQKVRCGGKWKVVTNPEGVIQFIIEDVDPRLKQIVNQSISQVEKAIENNIFPKNLNACGKMFGKPCVYINYCYKGVTDGLKVPDKKN